MGKNSKASMTLMTALKNYGITMLVLISICDN